MKHAVALSMFASSLALLAGTASADPHHGKHHVKPPRAEHARPAGVVIATEPAQAETSATPRPAKPSFWLASDPHVPLATVEGRQIRSVGKRGTSCGAAHRWARPKSRWHAVDAWGKITGHVEVKVAELYDVTQCREVAFTNLSGKPGVGLFVSDDSSYRPGDSAAFTPSVLEKKRFERFLGGVETAFVDRVSGKPVPLAKRTMFFEISPPRGVEAPHRWAVSGGPILTVAYLGRSGRWHASRVLPPLGLADSYKPVAVFDMNGDGIPEIVYSSNDGPSFNDAVMSLDLDTARWNDAAESPGGATL